jgi:uncharacterized protein YbjT (DUF2867 family)
MDNRISRKVLVLGGYGLIGSSIVRRLLDLGYDVTAVGRDTDHGRRILPAAKWLQADISRLATANDWLHLIEGMDIVVNAAGALQSGGRDDLVALQERAIVALVEACEKIGIKRFVQISAPSAVAEASTEFLRTKAAADERLKASTLEWTIIRPGLVISHDAYGGTALLRMLASFPLVLPLVFSDRPVCTADIEDVVLSVRAACNGSLAPGSDIDVGEGRPRSLLETLLLFREWLGFGAPLAVVRLPAIVASATSGIADVLGRAGWRSPLRSTAMKSIDEGILCDPTDFERTFGRRPSTLPETLARLPSTTQERLFARTYLMMPLMIGTLALFWIASGLIGGAMLADASTHLVRAGLSPASASVVVILGAIADVMLGVGILVKRFCRAACLGMVAITACYLVAGSILSPELWADPIGPYVKTIPAAVLALVVAILSRSR